MSELKDLAAKIDAMTLDELVKESTRQNLPEAGGDYDTKRGWEKRMGLGKDASRAVIAKLIDAGLAEIKPGQVPTSRGYTTVDMVYSPTLARKCGTV